MAASWLPDQLGIAEDNVDARAVVHGCECLTCCYTIDVCCAIPLLRRIETDDNKYNLTLFAFYELCWPCLWAAEATGVTDAARLRALTRESDIFHIFPPR